MTSHPTSPAAILSVPLEAPERLLPGGRDAVRRRWRELAARWHPDRHPGDAAAGATFRHLQALRDAALARLDRGPGELVLEMVHGGTFRLGYLARRTSDLGDVWIGRTTLASAVATADRDLHDAGLRNLAAIGFADAAMRRQLAASLPAAPRAVETADRLLLLVDRDPGLVGLADLLAHLGGGLEPRHAAWIVSGLCNIACWLASRGLVHGAIDAETVFVDAAAHRVALLGGWYFAARAGARLRALPATTAGQLPSAIAAAGRADPVIDRLLIRGLAACIAGAATPGGTLHAGRLPRPFAEWVAHPPAADAFADYARWERAREASFGRRRFVVLGVRPADVYPASAGD